MRIAVVGAGAIGCFLASRLHRTGHSVTLVGRPPQVEAINRSGLIVRKGHHTCRYAIHAVTELRERPHLLLLTVKSQDLKQACLDTQPHACGVPAIILQNGIHPESIASGVLGPEVVVGGIAMCAVSYLRPGEVWVDVPGWIVLARPAQCSKRYLQMAARTLGGAMPTYVSRNLIGARWGKLINNLSNGLSAATSLPIADLARNRRTRTLLVHVMREGHAVAHAVGVDFDHHFYGIAAGGPRTATIAVLQAALPRLIGTLPPAFMGLLLAAAAYGPLGRMTIRGSTWQSLVRGRPTEIEYLNGEVVRTGRSLGIPTPFNARVVEVVHDVERTGRFHAPVDLWPPAHTWWAAAGQPVG